MTKHQETLLKEFDIAARKCFLKEMEKAGVQSFGVCGIDLSDSGELIKVAAAVKMSK